MKFSIGGLFGKRKVRRRARRSLGGTGGGALFESAKVDQFNLDWLTSGSDVNAELFTALEPLRARSRELAANNPYMRRWLLQCRQNIIGHAGIRMLPRVRTTRGKLNERANAELDAAWKRWTRKGACEATGMMSFWAVELLAAETLQRDGEVLCELRPGQGSTGYDIKLWDADRLDVRLNDINPVTGNTITMGVELNSDGRPVSYWMLEEHPGAMRRYDGRQRHIQIPAERMIHQMIQHRPEQVRGIPAAYAAMLALRDLGQWRSSALIAARSGANKLAWWKRSNADDGLLGDELEDSDGGQIRIDNSGPGEVGEILDPDAELVEWNPTYPHADVASFNKSMLQGIAGGLGTFYPTLGNDYQAINLSSIRGGLLDERDGWRVLQRHMRETFHECIFRDWLRWQVMSGKLGQAPAGATLQQRIDRLDSVEFRPRGWQSPDPLKDAQANAVNWGMAAKSLREIIEDRGADAEEVLRDVADEREKLKAMGIEVVMPASLQKIDETQDDDDGDAAAPPPPEG